MRTTAEIEKLQRELSPNEDLTRYAGRWVAVREGRVVATAKDLSTLRAQDGVRDDDVVIPVSPARAGALVV